MSSSTCDSGLGASRARVLEIHEYDLPIARSSSLTLRMLIVPEPLALRMTCPGSARERRLSMDTTIAFGVVGRIVKDDELLPDHSVRRP